MLFTLISILFLSTHLQARSPPSWTLSSKEKEMQKRIYKNYCIPQA